MLPKYVPLAPEYMYHLHEDEKTKGAGRNVQIVTTSPGLSYLSFLINTD